MAAGARPETKSIDRIIAIACRHPGIGFAVTFKARAGNVATITTSSPHGFVPGDEVLVKGVDGTFDGRQEVLTAPTTTTFTYANAGSGAGSTAVTAKAGASKRVGQGYVRFGDGQNLYEEVRALTSEGQGYFWAALSRVEGGSRLGGLRLIRINAHLLVPVNKDTPSDLNAAWELALGLQDELMTQDNYETGEFWPEVTVGLEGVSSVQRGGIAAFDFGGGDAGGTMTIRDP